MNLGSRYTKAVKRECVTCHRVFLAQLEDTPCEIPDGTLIMVQEYVDMCPLCEDNQYGKTWNLYFMEDLKAYQSRYPYVDPYTVDDG